MIRQNLKNKKKEATLELYNLSDDPTESINVAEQHPDILKQAEAIFKREHQNAEIERFRIPLIENGLLANE